MKRAIFANQVFVGCPWKNTKAKYDKTIGKLARKYPLSFVIVGRDDGQEAVDLFEIIKNRILTSSWAIFDATGGNANVSLEFGFAEGSSVPKSIYFCTDGRGRKRSGGDSAIIADLAGKKRVQYSSQKSLQSHLARFCEEHAFTKRFNKVFSGYTKRNPKLKEAKKIALAVIRMLDLKDEVRRDDAISALQEEFNKDRILSVLDFMRTKHLINSMQGPHSKISLAD